jgi:hypothetical protein
MNFGICERLTHDPLIVVQEHHSRFVLKNPNRFEFKSVLIDGCVIKVGQRCDYLIVGPTGIEYFIELKGSDVEHAVNQLRTTILQIGSKAKGIERYSFIVINRCPRITPKVQLLMKRFKKDLNSPLHNSPLHIESRCCEISG